MHHVLQRWIDGGRVLALCPEVAGGLPTPRSPMEIDPLLDGADVLAGTAQVLEPGGIDRSAFFISGAQAALKAVRESGIRLAILKEGSPSCGSSLIADGHFSGGLVVGQGVTAAALRAAGVQVFSEHQLDQAAEWLMARERRGPIEDWCI